MVKIVTDSTSDLPAELVQKWGITVVPLKVRFGTREYRDGVDLTSEEFYRRLVSSQTLPTTVAPSPADFSEVYDKLAEETDEILTITLSSKLSATYEAALRGKEQRKRDCQVEVVDSLAAAMALGLIVIAAAEEAQAGASLEQIIALVRKAIPKAHVRGSFDTLEYLRRGGRIGRAAALLGSVLKVNPIIGVKDGEVYPFGRERSRAKSLDWLYNFVAGIKNIKSLAVEHATTPEEAEMLAQRLDFLFPREKIYLSTMSPVMGTHVGPHVLAVAVLEG